MFFINECFENSTLLPLVYVCHSLPDFHSRPSEKVDIILLHAVATLIETDIHRKKKMLTFTLVAVTVQKYTRVWYTNIYTQNHNYTRSSEFTMLHIYVNSAKNEKKKRKYISRQRTINNVSRLKYTLEQKNSKIHEKSNWRIIHSHRESASHVSGVDWMSSGAVGMSGVGVALRYPNLDAWHIATPSSPQKLATRRRRG